MKEGAHEHTVYKYAWESFLLLFLLFFFFLKPNLVSVVGGASPSRVGGAKCVVERGRGRKGSEAVINSSTVRAGLHLMGGLSAQKELEALGAAGTWQRA